MIVSRCKGLCRLGKWLLRRLRVRVVLLTDKDGRELNKQMNYFAEVVLFDATFWQDISPRKIGFLLKLRKPPPLAVVMYWPAMP
jgi:hypothetical protein